LFFVVVFCAFLVKIVQISEIGMISNEDIEARKLDIELNRSALES
jgi:hypothetical protein